MRSCSMILKYALYCNSHCNFHKIITWLDIASPMEYTCKMCLLWVVSEFSIFVIIFTGMEGQVNSSRYTHLHISGIYYFHGDYSGNINIFWINYLMNSNNIHKNGHISTQWTWNNMNCWLECRQGELPSGYINMEYNSHIYVDGQPLF